MNMDRRQLLAMTFQTGSLAAASALLSLPMAALAASSSDVAGQAFEHQVKLGSSDLVLNGAGIRYKVLFKVYAAGLYLSKPATTLEGVLAAPGAKRMRVTMLRDIDANELGKLFVKGMEENATREEFVKSLPATIKMGELFSARKRLKAGESFSIDYLPGTGTNILVQGEQALGPIKEPEFFNSLMKIWLGRAPADFQLKEALLAGKAP